MGSYSLPYTLTLPELAGWVILTAIIVAGTMDFRRRRRECNEVFPLPLTGRFVRLGVLQQYVLLETVAPVVLSVLALTFFMLMREMYRLIDLLMANWSLGLILQVIMAMLPLVFSFTVPIAILIGVLLGIGRMSVENEVRACQTAGVHLLTIFKPMIVICAVVTAGMLFVNYEYAPRMEKKIRTLKNQLAFDVYCAAPAGLANKIKGDPLSYVLFYGARDSKTGDMLQVRLLVEREAPAEKNKDKDQESEKPSTQPAQVASASKSETVNTPSGKLYAAEVDPRSDKDKPATQKDEKAEEEEEEPPPQRDIVLAQRGVLLYDRKTDDLTLNLMNGTVHSGQWEEPKEKGEKPGSSDNEVAFDSMSWPMSPKKEKKSEAEYRTAELIGALIAGRNWERWKNDEKRYKKESEQFKIDLARRTAFPFACIAFVLLGIPLAIFTRPSGKSISITMALILIWVYYWMVQWGTGMAEDGNDFGLFIIFLPNLLMAGLGVILFRRAVRL